jgi:hypothetical protein
MKWSGQHIYDLISRFRNDVYLEDISTGTIASGAHLGLDSNNKIVKAADGGGDLTSIVAGTGLSGTSLTGPIPTLNVDASQTQITSVGTIGTGVWQGTAIASAYLDADTAHLSGNQTFTGSKIFSSTATTFSSATADAPIVKLLNTTDDDQAGQLIFEKLRDDNAVAQGQNLGEIWFRGQDAAQNPEDYAFIIGEIDVSTHGQESGVLRLGVTSHDGSDRGGLKLIGGSEATEVDVEIGRGANSVITIPGNIDLAGDIDVDGTLETDALTIGGATIAAIGTTAITTLGTIGTGVWQGTTIKTAYIGDDQVTEDKLANTLLAEIDANTAKATNVTTNLTATTHASKITINSSDGTNVLVAEASGSIAGVMTVAHHDKLDGIETSATADQSKSDIDGLAITTVGTVDTGVWNGTKITDVYTNSSGKRYGSTIKILPSDFMINDDAASPLSFKDGANSGVHVNDATNEAIAFVTIPEGMKATHVDVFGTHNRTLTVDEVNVNASYDFTSVTPLGTGNCNTQLDITDTNATAYNYLAITVSLSATSNRVWGGLVTIAPQ